jgi:hypothetical protein
MIVLFHPGSVGQRSAIDCIVFITVKNIRLDSIIYNFKARYLYAIT